LKKAEARKHEEVKNKKNLEEKVDTKEKFTTLSSKQEEIYNVGVSKNENSKLLGFQ
jgi:hypothetical protein